MSCFLLSEKPYKILRFKLSFDEGKITPTIISTNDAPGWFVSSSYVMKVR